MRSYSSLDLIHQEMTYQNHLDSAKGFLDTIKVIASKKLSKNVTLRLTVPNDIYHRAKVFCDDVSEISEDNFDQSSLIWVLYKDFITYIRKHNNPHSVYQMLSVRNPDEPEINDYTGAYHAGKKYRKRRVSLIVEMERKEALRGEYALADLSKVYVDHPFTLEKVLEILYLDFMEEYQKGNIKRAVEKILRNWSE